MPVPNLRNPGSTTDWIPVFLTLFWKVVDPGFPRRGRAPTPKGGGRQPIIWPIFPQKYMKMKKFWLGGVYPLGSASGGIALPFRGKVHDKMLLQQILCQILLISKHLDLHVDRLIVSLMACSHCTGTGTGQVRVTGLGAMGTNYVVQ